MACCSDYTSDYEDVFDEGFDDELRKDYIVFEVSLKEWFDLNGKLKRSIIILKFVHNADWNGSRYCLTGYSRNGLWVCFYHFVRF